MTRHPLKAVVGDTGIEAAVAAVARLPAFAEPPAQLEVDGDRTAGSDGWVKALLAASDSATATWVVEIDRDRDQRRVDVMRDAGVVLFQIPDAFATAAEAVELLEQVPFEVASLGSVWPDEWADLDRELVTFGYGHVAHGWASAFRGAGHDHLVSRRWLDFGPWRVVPGPGDLSVVQFHDLAAAPATALAQAQVGHVRMGPSDTGGFLPDDYEYSETVKGLYDARRRTLEIVVPPGDAVAPARMRDACALRRDHRRKPPLDKPIEQLAFVFLAEADARAQLHELWLHELECWVADDRSKRRLDLDYRPVPEPPAWAR